MTAYFNQTISRFISTSSFSVFSNGIAVFVVFVMLAMVIEKVLLDAYEGNPNEKKTLAFTIGILPMFYVIVILAILRAAQILHL